MKQLLIQNGDLVVGAGGYVTVEGERKLRQDLSHALREPVGTDRFAPRWGSTLPGMIGTYQTSETAAQVKAEVSRVIQNYVNLTAALVQQDRLAGTRSRLRSDEVISRIVGINVTRVIDRVDVRVALQTLAGAQTTIAITE